MALGKVTQETNYNKPAIETLADLEKALNSIGKVNSVDQTKFSIKGKTKYGLQTVKIEATINGIGDESVISFTAKSDDIGGVGAKDGLKRLIEVMANVDNLDFEVSKTGFDTPKWLMWAYILLGGLGILVIGIMLINNADWVADNLLVIGFISAVYIWGLGKVFKKP
ncbi:MAG: hypothetical protein WBB69_07700 [Anaerolineales bacterium]